MRGQFNALITTLLLTLAPLPAAAQCFAWPVISVYDGDTLRASVDGRATPIRIMGLDTPELPPHARCEAEKAAGYAARDRLRQIVAGAAVVAFCPHGPDKYRRLLAVMLVDGRDVATVMIGEGLARPYQGGKRAGWCAP